MTMASIAVFRDPHNPNQVRTSCCGCWYDSKEDAANHACPNSVDEYDNLQADEKVALLKWIELAIQPSSRPGAMSSYGLKHEYEYDGGLYVINGAFKGAMLVAGYEPIDRQDMNWRFRIRPTCQCRRGHPGARILSSSGTYGVWHASDEQRKQFAELVAAVRDKKLAV